LGQQRAAFVQKGSALLGEHQASGRAVHELRAQPFFQRVGVMPACSAAAARLPCSITCTKASISLYRSMAAW
jgi:hypothetical protein